MARVSKSEDSPAPSKRGLPGVFADVAALRSCTAEVAIALLGIPPGTFRRQRYEGLIGKPTKRGTYDAIALVQEQRERLQAGTPKGGSEMQAAQLRYWQAHAEVEEIEADQQAGKVVLVELVDRLILEAFAYLRGEVDGNAGRLAKDMAIETDVAKCRRVLLDEYRAALDRAAQKLAELRLAGVIPAPPDSEGTDAAAEEDAE